MKTLDVTAANGVPFRVVFWPEGKSKPTGLAEPLVEFYDRRYPQTEHGQFTGARYYLRTLREDEERLRAGGLNLHGGVPNWILDAATYRTVSDWLEEQT